MGLFKKKLSDEELIKKNLEESQKVDESAGNDDSKDDFGESKLRIEVIKLKSKVEGLIEQRTSVSERFNTVNENVGELRGMIMDTNRAVGNIEASATKAIDLVASVEPDKLMTEVRKQDSKLEALKANLESNETMMKDVMAEVKEMRKKMDFFRGVEQIIKLNEEVKKELIQIKKTEMAVSKHSNKVEGIFVEVEKKFIEFDKFNDVVKDLGKTFEKLQSDVDKLRVKTEDKSDRKDLQKYVTKFNSFEKHTTSIIKLLDGRSEKSIEEMKAAYKSLVKSTEEKLDSAIKSLGIEAEKAGKAAPKVEKKKKSWRNIFKKNPMGSGVGKEVKAEGDTESNSDEDNQNVENNPEQKEETEIEKETGSGEETSEGNDDENSKSEDDSKASDKGQVEESEKIPEKDQNPETNEGKSENQEEDPEKEGPN